MAWLGTRRLYNGYMLHMTAIDGYLALDARECREFGSALADRYRNADPFPHIVLDELLDAGVLKEVLDDFPSNADKQFFDRDQERLKFQFQPHEGASRLVLNLFAQLNSPAFIAARNT